MHADRYAIKAAIRLAVQQLATRAGADASMVTDDDILPTSGLLDSAGLVELIVWYEGYLNCPVPQSDITIDNFGSINLMAEYAMAKSKQ